MTSRPLRLSTRLHLLLASGIAVLVAERGALVGLTVLYTGVLVGVAGWSALRPLGSRFFLAFAVSSAAFGAVFLSNDPAHGAELGLAAVLRAGVLIAMARWVSSDASPLEMADLGHRVRMPWLGLAVGVAINALPDLEASVRRSWDAARLRGGFRRERLRTLRYVAVSAITHALLRADAQAEAAQARGLQVNPPRRDVPPLWREEGWVIILAWAPCLASLLCLVIYPR